MRVTYDSNIYLMNSHYNELLLY